MSGSGDPSTWGENPILHPSDRGGSIANEATRLVGQGNMFETQIKDNFVPTSKKAEFGESPMATQSPMAQPTGQFKTDNFDMSGGTENISTAVGKNNK